MERIIKNAKLAYIPYLIYLAYLHVLMRANPGQDGVLLYIGAIKKQGLKKSVGILVGVFATIGVINASMLDLVLI